jgi:predicted aconitase with swiveling domain
MFEVRHEYTRDEIHSHLGGSKQSYLPTVAGAVVAACVKLELNPRAPRVILCGQGSIIAATGAALATQTDPIPVFIKRGVNRWQFQGKFRVIAAHSSGPQFDALVAGSGRQASDVSLAIELA